MQQIKNMAERAPAGEANPAKAAILSRPEALEERFLGLCLNHPLQVQNMVGACEQDFQNEKLGQIFCELKKLTQQGEVADSLKRLQQALSPELNVQVEYLSLKIQQQPIDELQIISEMEICLKELKLVKIRQQLNALSYEIKDAQVEVDKSKLKNLLEKFAQLSTELIQLTKK